MQDFAPFTPELLGALSRLDWTTKQFLAQLAKGNVSFCHHLSSVIR
jgi:hypothetical protein